MGLKKKSLAVCPQSQIMFGFVNHPIFLSSFHITQAQAFFDSKWDIIHVLCIFQPGLLNQWNAFIFKWKWTLEIDFLFLKKKKKTRFYSLLPDSFFIYFWTSKGVRLDICFNAILQPLERTWNYLRMQGRIFSMANPVLL